MLRCAEPAAATALQLVVASSTASSGGGGDTFIVNLHGVTDFDSLQLSEGQMLGKLREAVDMSRRYT